MQGIFDNPRASLGFGAAIAAVLILGWLAAGGVDGVVFFSFLMRLLHVLAAMVWVGLIVFVNFVQLIALQGADEQGRGFLGRHIIPSVAWWFRHASTVTVATGVVLLVPTGYMLPTLVYGSEVHVPTGRATLLWLGVAGGLAMWMFVHMYIWPSLQVVLGMRPGDDAAKASARSRVLLFARANLLLVVPVVVAMIAAAHL